jgi:sugar O-acyltransferase (sialic acid O-acetyltransferase NeuD family)
VVIFGAGDLARQISGMMEDINSQGTVAYELRGFLDKNHDSGSTTLKGYPILGPDELLPELRAEFVIGIAAPAQRQKLDEYAIGYGCLPSPVVHYSAYFESDVVLGDGAVVTQSVHVEEGVTVGRQAVFNVNSLIGQDASLGDYVIVSPHAVVGGRTRVGSRVMVGMGAVVLPDLAIGNDAIIGAGAVVTRDVPAGATVAGVPARLMARRPDW